MVTREGLDGAEHRGGRHLLNLLPLTLFPDSVSSVSLLFFCNLVLIKHL
jgi:hypothetical protein